MATTRSILGSVRSGGRAVRRGRRPAAPPSVSFRKVRADHAAETAQDYVEAVAEILRRTGRCRVTDLARHMGVSHVTVCRIIARLQEADLVETTAYRPIRLTARGARLAEGTRQRHETVLAFLRLIGVPESDALGDAEGIEHHVGHSTLQRMAAYVRGDATRLLTRRSRP